MSSTGLAAVASGGGARSGGWSARPGRLPVFGVAVWLVSAIVGLDLVVAYLAFARGDVELVLAAVVGIELLALCVFRPRMALLAFAGFWGVTHVILSNGEVEGGGSTSISQLVGVVVVLGFGLAAIRLHRARDRRTPFALRALIAFTALYVLAELITPLRHQGLSDLMKLAGATILAVVAYRTIDDERSLLRLSGVVAMAGVLVAGVAVAQYASGSSLGLGGYAGGGVYRATSALGSANGTADFLLVCAGFVLLRYTLLRDRRKPRLDLLALVAIAAGILVTFTRADVIALVVMLAIWASLWQVRSVGAIGLRARLVLVFAVAAVAVVQVVGSSALVSRLEGRLHPTSQASLLNGREQIWSSELKKLDAASINTILVGSGAHTSYTSVYVPQSEALREFPPHDLFLWLLVETGVIGLAVYSATLVSAGGSLLRASRRLRYSPQGRVAAVAFAGLVAFVVDSMFHNTQLSTGSYWYFALFLGATLRMAQPR